MKVIITMEEHVYGSAKAWKTQGFFSPTLWLPYFHFKFPFSSPDSRTDLPSFTVWLSARKQYFLSAKYDASQCGTTWLSACCKRLWYYMRCYFSVRLIADVSQLNLPHGTKLKSGKKEKLKSKKKRICLEVSINSPGNPWSQSWKDDFLMFNSLSTATSTSVL